MNRISHSVIADKDTSRRLETGLRFIWKDMFKNERQIILGTHQEWKNLTAYTACPRAVCFLNLGETEDSPKINVCKIPKNVDASVWADIVSEIFCHSYAIKAPKELMRDTILKAYQDAGVFIDKSKSSLITMSTIYKGIATKRYSDEGYKEIFNKMQAFSMTGFGEYKTLGDVRGMAVDEILPQPDEKTINILMAHNLTVSCKTFIYGCIIAGIYLAEKHKPNRQRGKAFDYSPLQTDTIQRDSLIDFNPINITIENPEEIFFDCDIFKEVYEVCSTYGISLKALCHSKCDLPQYILPNTENVFES